MMTFFPKTNIDFLKYRKVYFTVSILIFVLGIFLFATKGLNLGIDFTGGTMVQVKFEQDVDMSKIREALTATGQESELQSYGHNSYAVREKGTEENRLRSLPHRRFLPGQYRHCQRTLYP